MAFQWRHEVWEGELGSEFCLASKDRSDLRAKINPDAKLVHVIYATSYLETQTLYREWRGWGAYEPVAGFDFKPYTAEEAYQQRSEGFS